ncbi:MAG: hypothetical protein A2W93_07315 [Bacteroidetes bacterium GWF2_43_63]|nr:MAG: hypothetical protein A2W94_15385 [Bacteroidetes bacterium GWE2_42_42]OFY54062.1 MAG: hypothetical protein A2W93_07315 [Bacteroidetes bacterium GWF2_43_63]HCB63554.1 endonuclease [Bacteroidales bacterium]HCY23200.1 endonuclease [Bacteroidales bacterium]
MKNIILTFILVAVFFGAQAQEKSYNVTCIAFYNLENLFDTINDPNINDEEFLPEGSNRWTGDKYLEKLGHMADVITQIGDEHIKGGPVCIGVSEVENISALTDLANQPKMKASGYVPILIEGPDRRGVDVGFLYRKDLFTLVNATSHRLVVADQPNFRTRDQLLVKGIILGDTVHFIVNHWPSRSGGEKRSAPMRAATAQLARTTVDSIMAVNPNAKIFIMGDLNDNPTNASVYKVLKAARDKETAINITGLYNPMYNMFKVQGIGSNAYRDSWSLFDQIIVSKGLLGDDKSTLKLYKTLIFNRNFLKQTEGAFAGYPFRTYVGGQYQGGYSDHFPAYMFLIKEK